MATRRQVQMLAEELIDTSQVAEILGLGDPRSVSVYQKRYPDMPRPIVDRGTNRVKLWFKPEIVDWSASRHSD